MPTYEYRCSTCGGQFDLSESIKGDALKICPSAACVSTDEELRGKGEVRRIVSGGAGIVFKGDGFYETDYVKKKAPEGTGEGGGSSESSASDPPAEPAAE